MLGWTELAKLMYCDLDGSFDNLTTPAAVVFW